MTGGSGGSAQVVSLPKGGGALKGLGEKFSPDLHTGTGNFTVPISVPSGRNGFQPELSLVYSTGSGNGPFGLGWSLSIPGISRQTSKGIPTYDDTNDIFVLSGSEDLVPVERLTDKTRYRPRTEGLFARIHHHRSASDDFWEVQSKDGLVSYYGTPGSAAGEPATLADPERRGNVFAWKLTRTSDPFGNRIEYDYERDSREEAFHNGEQLYLQQIRYADYEDLGGSKFLVSVGFEYEERPDPFSEYRAGFELRTRKRCRRIHIRTHASEDRSVRTYEMVYLDQNPNADHLLPPNGVSLLDHIRVVGHDQDRSEEMPPLEFGYTVFEPEKRDFIPLQGADLPARSLANADTELVDLFGNGLPDILEMNGAVRYWRNLGDGWYDRPREMREAPAGVQLADPGVQLIDANGDGRTDLLVSANGSSGYYPLRFGGMWDRRSFQRFEVAPSFDLEDPEVKLVDLDGDGVTDVVRSGSRFECFFSEVNGRIKGWTPEKTRWVERRALEDFPDVSFSDQRVKWADMTGDGSQDIVLVHDGNVEYWPNLGHGDWGRRVSMRSSPRLPHGHDPRRVLIGDVDGDGPADFLYVDDGKVTLWINKSGNGFGDPIKIRGTPSVTDMDAVSLVDALGAGVGGVLWSADADGLSRESMYFLDLTGGVKPYLLTGMNNHMGSVTRVEYTPSTRFYLEDEKHPRTRWKTPLPFPVQVVSRVEARDEISRGRLTTEYRYHHGYWDGAEREFCGFGVVEQLDTETFEDRSAKAILDQKHFSPPMLTRTWFHQGPIGDELGEWEETDFGSAFWAGDPRMLSRPPSMTEFLRRLPRRAKRDALRALRGRVLRTELYALDGTEREQRPYTVSESLYGVCEVVDEDGRHTLACEPRPGGSPTFTDDGTPRIFYPHDLAQRTTQWERGVDPMTRFGFTEDYDEYGQPRRQTQIACPRGWRRPEDIPDKAYLATRTTTIYARPVDDQAFIMDRVARTTTCEIQNAGAVDVLTLKDVQADNPSLQVIGQSLIFYDRDPTRTDNGAFQGLPFGQVGAYGAPVRTENLVLTENILREAYRSGSEVQEPPEVPPYLNPGGSPVWTAEYPKAFRELLPSLAGYTFQPGGAEYHRGYFASSERRRYDFHGGAEDAGRGLIEVMRDPLGRDTTITYDEPYYLLPTEVTDHSGLKTKAGYDYRVLRAKEVTDPNGNRTFFVFTPLGLLKGIAVAGKEGVQEGDTLEQPGTVFDYDFLAFAKSPPTARKPVSVHTIKREKHRWAVIHEQNAVRARSGQPPLTGPEIDALFPTDELEAHPERFVQSREYSDGFGRLLQARTETEEIIFGDDATFGGRVLSADQAVPGTHAVGHTVADPAQNPRVVVSGWQVYDNKGRVVERYEPFFSLGWDYAPPADAQLGQKATLFYDSRGQAVRTVNPDGSEQLVVHGVPGGIASPDLTDPAVFEPTPWEAYTYDPNDNAGRTHPAISTGYRSSWNTPTSAVVDALGRTVETVERNGSNPSTDWYVTRSTYDVRGNLLTVTDPLERVAFRHVYDLVDRALRTEQLDAGLRRMIADAAGNTVEQRDSRGALLLHAHDALNRPIRLWARDGTNQTLTLRERFVYGDSPDSGLTPAQTAAGNLLGKPYRQHDEAGLVANEAYDFKGNVLEKMRQVIGDTAILSVFKPAPPKWEVRAFRTNWQPPQGTSLEAHARSLLAPAVHRTSMSYDAMNRVETILYPEDVNGARKVLRPEYNRAGTLERVVLDGKTHVERIAYDAKGQRIFIAYGNSVMTRYAYDPKTFRLTRMRTERFTTPDPLTYRPTGAPLQDFGYEYDLVGNLLALHDHTSNSGVPSQPDLLDRAFAYDPLYRLLSATGRECDIAPSTPWSVEPRCSDVTRTRAYSQTYQYDPAGNLRQLRHGASGGAFTRVLALAPDANRLASVTVGDKSYNYAYDDSGNMTGENASRHFEWDHSNRMRVYRTQVGEAEPTVYVHYLYDAGGERVKKLVRKKGQVEVTVYVDGVFEHHRVVKAGSAQENNTLHVMDDRSRIAQLRVGRPFDDDKSPATKYHLGDHLGSSNLVVDDAGSWLNREEYTPYGETSFGSFVRKRYRYTGKERDEESGLYYHGARNYAPWLGRWASCDPAGMVDGVNTYSYCRNNPLLLTDPGGTQSEAPATQNGSQQILLPHQFTGAETSEEVRAFTESKGYTFTGDPTWDPSTKRWHVDTMIPIGEASGKSPARQEEGFWSSIVSGKEEAGFWKSLIPVIGSVQNANYHFDKGNWGRGVLYTALAVTDVFLVRSLATGVVRLAARGTVALKGIGQTLLKELAPGTGVGSGTKFVTKLRRFFIQDLKTYQTTASVTYRVLREHFRIATSKGTQSMFEMHHWLIQHGWYSGSNAISNRFVRDVLKSLGNAGWNLVPLPAPINNALGKSASATIAFAQKLGSTVWHEVQWASNNLRQLYREATAD